MQSIYSQETFFFSKEMTNSAYEASKALHFMQY